MPFSDLWNLPAGSETPVAAQSGYSAADAVKGLNPLQKLNWTMQNRGPGLAALGAGVARGDVAGGFADAAKLNYAQDVQNQEVATKEKARLALKQYLMSQGMSEQEAEQASQNSAVTEHIWKLQEIEAKKKADADAASADMGLNLSWTTDKNGKWHAWQLSKNGTMKEFRPPDGSDPVPPGDIALAKSQGTQSGKTAVELQQQAAQVEQNVANMDSQVDDLLNDPYLPNMVGKAKVAGVPVPWVLNKDVANRSPDSVRVQKKMDLVQSATWLQARDYLKGQGAITDQESAMASEAFNSLDPGMSLEDYKKAANTLRAVVKQGMWRLKKKMAENGQGPDPGPPPTLPSIGGNGGPAGSPRADSGGDDPLGVR